MKTAACPECSGQAVFFTDTHLEKVLKIICNQNTIFSQLQKNICL